MYFFKNIHESYFRHFLQQCAENEMSEPSAEILFSPFLDVSLRGLWKNTCF